MAATWIPFQTLVLAAVSLTSLGLAVCCYRLLRANQKLTQQLNLAREAEHHANHDPLTGLLNRRGWEIVLQDAIGNHQARLSSGPKASLPLCLALLDVDQFKQINDRYGHPVGDRVLAELSNRLLASFTNLTGESIARIGGEEFALLSHQTPESLQDRFQSFIESLRLAPIAFSDHAIPCSCSVGIASYQPGEPQNDWFARADQAMYRAKRSGGAGVVNWECRTNE